MKTFINVSRALGVILGIGFLYLCVSNLYLLANSNLSFLIKQILPVLIGPFLLGIFLLLPWRKLARSSFRISLFIIFSSLVFLNVILPFLVVGQASLLTREFLYSPLSAFIVLISVVQIMCLYVLRQEEQVGNQD